MLQIVLFYCIIPVFLKGRHYYLTWTLKIHLFQNNYMDIFLKDVRKIHFHKIIILKTFVIFIPATKFIHSRNHDAKDQIFHTRIIVSRLHIAKRGLQPRRKLRNTVYNVYLTRNILISACIATHNPIVNNKMSLIVRNAISPQVNCLQSTIIHTISKYIK